MTARTSSSEGVEGTQPDPRLSDEQIDAIEARTASAITSRLESAFVYRVCERDVPRLVAELRVVRERETALRTALAAIVKADTRYRRVKRCSDPQTWDHDCDEEYTDTVGDLGGIAQTALGGAGGSE